jgi:ectoine hydroxylase
MDKRCLKYRLTDEERAFFNKNGYLMIPDALTKDRVRSLRAALDKVYKRERRKGLGPYEILHTRDFFKDDLGFVDLIDYYKTLPKVWDILGWNIHLYLAHANVTPPEPEDKERGLGLNWHQDTSRVNIEMETSPRPRLSVKVAFFLSDTSEEGRGNFHVIPGSQLKDSMKFPTGGRKAKMRGSIPILAAPGTAVIFDRRLWHSASANYWSAAREAIFFGYSYRWLAPRGPCNVKKYWQDLDPIQKQLCRQEPSDVHRYTTPFDEDVPLRGFIEKHLGKEAIQP